MDWFKKVVFENYANFSGRARRKEYWMFMLFYFIFSLVLGLISALLGVFGSLLLLVWSLGLFLPTIAVTIRRFHDSGKTGWWYLASFAPIVPLSLFAYMSLTETFGGNMLVASLVLLVISVAICFIPLIFLFLNSEPGANQWGPNPKDEGEYQEMPPAL